MESANWRTPAISITTALTIGLTISELDNNLMISNNKINEFFCYHSKHNQNHNHGMGAPH